VYLPPTDGAGDRVIGLIWPTGVSLSPAAAKFAEFVVSGRER
jgi:hypothetical protein